MNSFYQGLDVYLNTSVHEGIPMTILEALSHGLPVIAPAVGGIVEIIDDGKEGFLIDSRNPHEFAEKCLLLKENRELREKMSRAAREKAEQTFSAKNMAERYYQLYRRESQTILSTKLRG
jgi:L-malate glycosyltransferase